MTAPDERDEARATLRSLPGYESFDGPIERLGGLTNRVYRAGDVVLRLPGKGSEDIINRAHEAEMAQITAKAGVSPAVLYVNPKTGIMVTQLVPDAVTMTPDGFRSVTGAPGRAGQAFRKLHRSGGEFPFRFELFAMIDQYLGVLASKDVELPDGYHDVVAEAQRIRQVLDAHPVPLAPCHCDPLCENFLDTGSRMWIVDWEYAGMNDPMWDLGDLSVEGSFNADQEAEMMRAYFGAEPTAFDTGRMVIYKAMCDLLWTLWGLIQHANKNPADDFLAYANGRFARCKTLMAEASFQDHVKAVANGP